MTEPIGMTRMLKIDDVAELLNIRTAHVRHLMHKEGLPVIKVSTHVHRFPEDEVLAWVEARRKSSIG